MKDNWKSEEQVEMLFAQSMALMGWFQSQQLGPEASIPCMALTIVQILASRVKEGDDDVMIKRVLDMLNSGMKLIREMDRNRAG